MQLFAVSVMSAAVATASLLAQASEPLPSPRFNVEFMDREADPCVDFARYAFGRWQEDSPVPADRARWGSFDELDEANQIALRGIAEAVSLRRQEPGSIEQKVGDLYSSAMDTATIEAAGFAPLQSDLDRIAAIDSPEALSAALAYFHNLGVSAGFSVSVGPDSKNSSFNALSVQQGGMSLPSRNYYFESQFENVRTEFLTHVAKMFMLAGDAPDAAEIGARTVFNLELSLAENSRNPVALRDPQTNYHKMPTAEFAALVPGLLVTDYLVDRGIDGPAAAEIIVGQPEFFTGLQQQLTTRPISDWRTYLRYRLLRSAAATLSAAFEQEEFRFYNTVIRGTPAMEPRWRRAVRSVNSELGEALGELYVAQYYPEAARAKMEEMIHNLSEVIRDRLAKLEWMTEPTRQRALEKFARFTAKIGHPEEWRDYSAVNIRRGAYFQNVREATQFEVERRLSKLGEPVDKKEWGMTPPTVNAYFSATQNNINFPAGILQPPFFDFTIDDAVNYGGIGAVIGHEITHGFDDRGRQYDAEGNLKDWWSEVDATEFKARAKKLVDQYSQAEVLPGAHVNGELTLGENIADLGGLSISYEALQRSLQGKERPLIDGLTPEQRFFISWAQVWRANIREAALRNLITVDSHSPAAVRAAFPLKNLPEFYEAFGVKEGDPMWLAPEDRAVIW